MMHKETSTRFDERLLGSEQRTPFLALDLAVFEQNVEDMLVRCRAAGVGLVPHAKTHRVRELGVRQVAAGADGLCVATLEEAEVFADAGVAWIVLAHPATAESAAASLRIGELARLTLAVDSLGSVLAVAQSYASASRTAEVYIIVDSGLGREGVRPEDAPALAVAIRDTPGVDLQGVMTHEGTVYHATDPADRDRRSIEAARLMVETADRIRAAGVRVPHVSMGASASVRTVVTVPGVTHVRPGIFAFNDLGQIALGNALLDQCAVRVVATVVSTPERDRACIDAGSKALGQDLLPGAALRDAYPGHGLLIGAPGWRLERLSETHGWLRPIPGAAAEALRLGARVTIVPNHVCTAFYCARRVLTFMDARWHGELLTIGAGSGS